MGLLEVFGKVGGVQKIIYLLAGFILTKYSGISFKISMINFMNFVTTEDRSIDCQDNNLQVSPFNKLRLITNMCPNLTIKRFIDKGTKRLNQDLDMMGLIKQHKHHHGYFNRNI